MLGRVIRLKVFIEGVEVPAYRATVQASIGAPAAAIIDLPPAEEFFERFIETSPGSGKFTQKTGVLPRSLIHVFYEDSEDPDGATRLLFEGEIVKYEYVKDVNRRTVRVIARDLSNLLSYIYVRYYSDFFTPYGNLISAIQGIGTADKPTPENIRLALINIGTTFNPEVMKALQDDKEGVGVAVAFKEIMKSALKINTFFRSFEERTKIASKVFALADVKSRELLNATQLASIIQQNMSNLKESATVWDLYMMLMSLVYYFPVPILAAPFIKNKITDTGLSGSITVTDGNSLMELLLKPYTWWTAAPTFNVIFPSQYKTFTFGRDFLAEPTRLVMSAFGIIESLAQEDFKKSLPSHVIFIAPEALAKKFDREAFDTRITKAAGSATVKTISGLETEIEALEQEIRKLEVAILAIGLTDGEKATKRNEIAAKEAEVKAKTQQKNDLIASVEREANIVPITESQGKKTLEISSGLWNRNILNKADDVSLSSREDVKGIVFDFAYMTQTQAEVTKSKAVSPTAIKTYLSYAANYNLVIQQHRTRVTTMNLHFCPQLVPGFPTLVIDPHRNFYGELDSITHVIDAEGLAETQISLQFVRTDEVQFSEFGRSTPGKVQFPKWINTKYLPSQIGQDVYRVLFPLNGSLPASQSVLSFGTDQISAANDIRRRYFSSKDKERFAYNFTKRNIASLEQVFNTVLGAVRLGDKFIFNQFSDERFQGALEYATAVGKASAFARSENPEEAKT